jgi:hypothetical protein
LDREQKDPGREGTTVKPIRLIATTVFLSILLSFHGSTALAAGTDPDEEKIPSTAVARLKIVKGTAWVRPADSAEWEEYPNNAPVAERARVSVPQGSEAELQFRGSQFLLLEQGAEVDVRQLGDQRASFRLRAGQVAFSLSKEDFAPVAVKVPGNRDVRLDAPGLYWLTMDGGETKFRVRRGEGAVVAEGAKPVAVKAGEEASIGKEVRVTPTGQSPPQPAPEATLTEAEQQAGIPQAAATELREYGEWVQTPEYGYVWRPYVAEGWAPYYYGQWSWVYPYGWNWVGYEPWGWWPYHYGWWVSYPAWGWVWSPYNCFYTSGYYYNGYHYPYRTGYYYPGNVRFVNDGRYIRWVPEQPGRTATRATFSRTDARLARWDKPLPAGTVEPRGGGRTGTTKGKGAVAGSTGGRAPGVPADRGTPGTAFTRSTEGGSRQKAAGPASGKWGSRPSAEGGGRVSSIPQGTGPPWRPYDATTSSRNSTPGTPGRAPVDRGAPVYGGGDSQPRGYGGGYTAPPTRGYTGPMGYETAPRGSFDGAAPRGTDGGTRGSGGSWGGNSGGGSRGGGSWGGGSWGGGSRTR